MQRLPYNATTEEEVIQYFKTRHLQLASAGFSWNSNIYKNPQGYTTQFIHDASQKVYDAFYVLSQDRNKGASTLLANSLGEIVTINDCKVIDFFNHINKSHLVVDGPFNLPAYKAAEEFYGDGKAARSKVWFMNHIDEGMIILSHIKSSQEAMAGFCLHPLTQDDENLNKNFGMLTRLHSSYSVGLSLEYRNIANQYLSKREIKSLSEINLSPLYEVNDMLIADKIQNYKDFIKYHRGTHPRSDILEKYFNNWLDKLQCREIFNWYIDFSKQFECPVKVIEI